MKPLKDKAKRLKGDQYMTPEPLCAALVKRLRNSVLRKPSLIVEPSAGTGNFVRALRAAYALPQLLAVELYPKYRDRLTEAGADDVVTADFLTLDLAFHTSGPVLVAGNPPYRDGELHVRAALERMRDGDILAYLMRLAFLCSQERARGLYKQYPLYQLHPIAKRPNFRTKAGNSDNSEYSMLVWKKGFPGPATLMPHIWWGGATA